jgi:hypothetical protein
MSTSRLNPIWTASQLNEALARAEGDVWLELCSDGRIDTYDLSLFGRQSQPIKRRSHGGALVFPVSRSDEFDTGLQQLPPALAFLAINPEPWCSTQIFNGSQISVGPFLDYANPLWEWLVRAARTDEARFVPLREGLYPFSQGQDSKLDRERIPLPQLVHDEQSGAPPWLRRTLDDFDLGRIVDAVRSAADATAVLAGLMELHDLSESHELAQSIEGRGTNRAGDYWHAIHHRREPDVENAKYWLRRVGTHPIHEKLAAATQDLLSTAVISDQATDVDKALQKLTPQGAWDAFAFADLCNEAPASQNPELIWAARRLQFLEMTLLLDSAYDDATT